MTAVAPSVAPSRPQVTYLDSSALVKLVVEEPETASLRAWLRRRPWSPPLTSELARVEVSRAVARSVPSALLIAQLVIARTHKVVLSAHVLDAAGMLPPTNLRTLDAIHLASAMALRPHVDAFVAYDKRLLTAAEDVGLPVAHPGAD